jgi:flagellar M-ring protein FliF
MRDTETPEHQDTETRYSEQAGSPFYSPLSPLHRLAPFWADLPTKRKLIIGLAVAAVVAGIVTLALWSSRPDYSVLFSDLSPEDMQSIETELNASGVPYKLSADGTSIMVPSSQLHKMRLRLSVKGLPEVGAIGFEGFDKTDFGMTDFVQQLKYQRALQVELGRTIAQLKEVMAARVHIVLPRETVFTEREQPAKASVVLNLRPGARLNHSQINGIVHLVASAVEGLQKENITVLDTSGKMLSAPSEEAFVNNSQLEYQRSVESQYESQLQNMLDVVLGPSKATVQVAAEIDFTMIETSSEVYDPDKTVVKSEQNVEYTTRGTVLPSGIPGVTSNVTPNQQNGGNTPYPWKTGSSILPEYDRSDATTEYEVSKTVQHTIQRPGRIAKLSVAVVVDNKTVDGESTPWTQQELADLKGLIRNAVGGASADPSRGDPEIEIRNIPFDTSLQQETAAAEKSLRRERMRNMIAKAGIVIAIIVFLALALRSVLKRRLPEEMLALPEASMVSADLGLPTARESAAIEEPAEEAAAIKPTEAQVELSALSSDRQQILALLETDPELMVQLVREWLSR